MNHPINHINKLSQKESRTILGCLSGTSMDGFDMGVFELSGSGKNTKFRILSGETISYPSQLKKFLNDYAFNSTTKLCDVLQLDTKLGFWYAKEIKNFMIRHKIENTVDLIASHGQTIYHAPDVNGKFHGTLQFGDGDIIAHETGLTVISDFRKKHIAVGGEGAPLAAFADYLLHSNAHDSRMILNIGGISNFTWLKAGAKMSEIQTGDCGPGNTLLDAYARKLNLPHGFDKNGLFASKGTPDKTISNEFVKLKIHKTNSTGPEDYVLADVLEFIKSRNTSLSTNDIMATLVEITVDAIIACIRNYTIENQVNIFVCGGGAHNTYLMNRLKIKSGLNIKTTAELGIDPDFKETLLFAVLANEWIAGDGFSYNGNENIRFGKLSLG